MIPSKSIPERMIPGECVRGMVIPEKNDICMQIIRQARLGLLFSLREAMSNIRTE